MTKKKTATIQTLTKAEEEIMKYIWELGRCTVSDILQKIGKNAPPHSTISSIVRILEKKGYVDHKAYGRTYEYFPLISKDGELRRRLTGLVADYFGGATDALVNFLVKEQDLTPADLKALLKRLESK